MTEVAIIRSAAIDRVVIARAAERLRAGQLVAFPTETVYGLGVNALDRDAVRRVFAAKGRPPTDPLIVHVSSLDAVADLVTAVPGVVTLLASRFWPGPLSVVLPRSTRVPDEVTAGLETVAIRVPAHPVALALLDCAGIPVAAPSANLFSRPSPTTAAHVLEDLDGRIDLVLDAGPTSVGVESTVLDISRGLPVVLRLGAVTLDMLLQVLPDVETLAHAPSSSNAMPSPGMLDKHYSPRAPLTLYEGSGQSAVVCLVNDAIVASALGDTVGIVAAIEDRDRLPAPASHIRVVELGSLRDSRTVAARLYAALRELDAAGVDLILARAFPADDGLGAAIRDRLRRAAAGRIVST